MKKFKISLLWKKFLIVFLILVIIVLITCGTTNLLIRPTSRQTTLDDFMGKFHYWKSIIKEIESKDFGNGSSLNLVLIEGASLNYYRGEPLDENDLDIDIGYLGFNPCNELIKLGFKTESDKGCYKSGVTILPYNKFVQNKVLNLKRCFEDSRLFCIENPEEYFLSYFGPTYKCKIPYGKDFLSPYVNWEKTLSIKKTSIVKNFFEPFLNYHRTKEVKCEYKIKNFIKCMIKWMEMIITNRRECFKILGEKWMQVFDDNFPKWFNIYDDIM